jgi:hypothetical protein
MKHIKVFEDFTSTGSKKLREFTESYLAYLLDEGVEIQIELGGEPDTYGLFIQRFGYFIDSERYFNIGFKWNDIKDHFIPFLYMLDKEYEIESSLQFGLVEASGKWAPHKWRSVEEILNDKVNERKSIVSICIDLKEKK